LAGGNHEGLTLDVTFELVATAGVPLRVGNIGTVTVEKVLPDGRTLLRFAVSRHFAKKITRRSGHAKGRLVDRFGDSPQNDGDN
jgi:hypothetical protein